ncbi:MAG: hypothetical protein K2J15_01700 [Muribaculaceae bacterium]|nr:hypothetical protein [Muribaculaceae bacterium]
MHNDIDGKAPGNMGKKWIIRVIAGLVVIALAAGVLLWLKPRTDASPGVKGEEQQLLGDEDALLIDADDEEDDDDILLGANPTASPDSGSDGKKENSEL